MDAEDIQDLRRARTLAGWAYLGLVIPIVGWILGGMSLSASKYIEPKTIKARKRVESVQALAWGSILLSIVAFASYIGVGVLSARAADKHEQQLMHQKAKEQRANEAQASYDVQLQYQTEQRAAQEEASRKAQLQACVDDVNDRAQKAAQSAYNSSDFAMILQFKEQYTHDCEVRYAP